MTNEETAISENSNRYLVFKLGNEVFATPLLGVREVVEYSQPKPIPNTVKYFTGVINIRGQIVGVMDLRARFGHPAEIGPGVSMMVFETQNGTIAAIVDKVESVINLQDTEIEKRPSIIADVEQEYLLGVGKRGEQLITLIDLSQVLAAEEIIKMKTNKMSA